MSKDTKVDVIVQADSPERKDKGLFVFDMDSTLIQQEVIDMIAAYANVEAEVSKITEAAMNGEIDFNESLTRRVGLLKGIRSDVLSSSRPTLDLLPVPVSCVVRSRSSVLRWLCCLVDSSLLLGG